MNFWPQGIVLKMNKALSYVGLATRAGKLVSGDEIVLKAIRSSEAKMVIVAADASANTLKNSVTSANRTTFLF